MTAGFNFNNYAAGFCSATPALRGNGIPKAKRLKPKMVPVAGWKETQVSDMDFDTIMEKAYEEYFEDLAEGEEALSFSEFKQALSSSAKSNG